MANVTLKKEEDIFAVIQSIQVDETRLTEQKENLTTLLRQLETKAKEELKKRKRKVDRLNSEVLDLQEKCNKLIYWVNQGSTLECSQATPSEDKDGNVKEPCEVEVVAALPEDVEATPTEDRKVMPPQAGAAKRNWLFGSSDK